MAKKIVAVLGTYRRGRVIETIVDQMLTAAEAAGVESEKIILLDKHVEFCTNCRACTQTEGIKRGPCPIQDDVDEMLDKLEAADGIIWASPMNYGDVTALMRRFIERLLCYAYWPWDVKKPPTLRNKNRQKSSVLVTSSMCPAWIGRFLMPGALKTLKGAAHCLSGKVVGKLYLGMVAISAEDTIDEKASKKAFNMGQRLVSRL